MNDITVTITQGGTPPVTIQSPAGSPVEITGGETINLSVGSGPPGPAGPQGPQGLPGSAVAGPLSGATDAVISSPQAGDLLRYDNGKWRNYPDRDLLDEGNF